MGAVTWDAPGLELRNENYEQKRDSAGWQQSAGIALPLLYSSVAIVDDEVRTGSCTAVNNCQDFGRKYLIFVIFS